MYVCNIYDDKVTLSKILLSIIDICTSRGDASSSKAYLLLKNDPISSRDRDQNGGSNGDTSDNFGQFLDSGQVCTGKKRKFDGEHEPSTLEVIFYKYVYMNFSYIYVCMCMYCVKFDFLFYTDISIS